MSLLAIAYVQMLCHDHLFIHFSAKLAYETARVASWAYDTLTAQEQSQDFPRIKFLKANERKFQISGPRQPNTPDTTGLFANLSAFDLAVSVRTEQRDEHN